MAETRVEITAVDKTAAAFKSVRGGLQGLGRQVLSAQSALLTLAGVGGLGLLVKNAFASGDAVAKLSDRIGITTGRLIGLQTAANLAGVDSDKLTLALRTLNKGVIDAARGTGEAQVSLQRLGLSATQLAGMPIDQQFTRIGEALMRMSNVNDRNAAAMKIFGDRSSEVLNLFAEGGDALRQAQDDVDKLGVSLTRVDAAKLEMANDSMSRAKLAFQGVGNTIAIHVAPFITDLANRFVKSAKESNGFRDTVIRGMELASEAVALGANVVQGLRFAWAGLKVVIGFVLDGIIQGLAKVDQVYTEFYNKLAASSAGKLLGIQATEVNQSLQLMAEVSAQRLSELQDELDKIAMEGLPAERIRAWFANVKAEAEKAAQDIADKRANLGGGGGGFDPIQGEGFGKMEEQLRSRIERMAQSQLTEREQLASHLMQTQMMLDEAFVLGLITQDEQNRLLEQEELNHLARMGNAEAQAKIAGLKFQKMTLGEKVQNTIAWGLQELQGVAMLNKSIFKIHQKLALAQLAIEMPAAIGAAVERGGGLPWGAVFGAMTAAKYIGLIAQAKGASFESSTSPSNVGGGGATPVFDVGGGGGVDPVPAVVPQATTQRPERVVNIMVDSDTVVSGAWIRDRLIPEINEAVGDGVTVNVSGRFGVAA